jgi:ABC-type phosphate/phosphonate transport system substrate-binding protein
VVLSSLDYLNIKNRVDVVLSLGQAKGGKGSVKYLLLTNANRRYTKLGELKDKKLLITMKDEIAAMYLNTLLLKERFGEAKKFFSAVEEKTKPSQAVLSVFFGQADACVTTDVALKTMVELNPQLGKTLNIMASSPELVTTVTVFRRSTNINVQQNTREIGLKLKDNPRGRQVLLLFKIDGLVPVQESDLVGIRELMGEYDRLRAGKR